jgi:hypothetical protein
MPVVSLPFFFRHSLFEMTFVDIAGSDRHNAHRIEIPSNIVVKNVGPKIVSKYFMFHVLSSPIIPLYYR